MSKEHDEWVLAMIKDKDPDLYRAVLAEQDPKLAKELETEEKQAEAKHRQWQNRQAIMLDFFNAMAAKRWQQRDFAEQLGVSQATVSSLLSKRANPRLSSLLKMADTLGLELTLKSAKIKE